MGLTSNEGIPNDVEQQAANEGVVTDAQKAAIDNMTGQIAAKVQTVIDSKRVDSNVLDLQSGFNSVQERAKQARTQGNPFVNEKKPKPVAPKKSMWSWLTGE